MLTFGKRCYVFQILVKILLITKCVKGIVILLKNTKIHGYQKVQKSYRRLGELILGKFGASIGKLQRKTCPEDLDSTDGVIDTIKEKLRSLFRELKDNMLDTDIIHEHKFFFGRILFFILSKLISIVCSKKYLALLKHEKILKLALNIAKKTFKRWQGQE